MDNDDELNKKMEELNLINNKKEISKVKLYINTIQHENKDTLPKNERLNEKSIKILQLQKDLLLKSRFDNKEEIIKEIDDIKNKEDLKNKENEGIKMKETFIKEEDVNIKKDCINIIELLNIKDDIVNIKEEIILKEEDLKLDNVIPKEIHKNGVNTPDILEKKVITPEKRVLTPETPFDPIFIKNKKLYVDMGLLKREIGNDKEYKKREIDLNQIIRENKIPKGELRNNLEKLFEKYSFLFKENPKIEDW
jgi:hypothetical protein